MTTFDEQRRGAIQPVYELAVRQRDEEGEHSAEVDDEEPWHHALVPQDEQRETRGGGEEILKCLQF